MQTINATTTNGGNESTMLTVKKNDNDNDNATCTSFGNFGIYNSSQPKKKNNSQAAAMIPSLHVFGNCLEQDEQNRRDIFDRVEQSLAPKMRFSHVHDDNMTHILTRVRRNPIVQHVELDSCQLTGKHFALLPTSVKLVSCSVIPSVQQQEQQQEEDTIDVDDDLDLYHSCASNTILEHLQIHDLVLDRSMASCLMSSFRAFPRLHSFSLVACHLTNESYAALTAFLSREEQLPPTTTCQQQQQQEQQPFFHSLAIDLRVWSEAAIQHHGLAQAIGSFGQQYHNSSSSSSSSSSVTSNLQLNGRILEQVQLPTLLVLLGHSSETKRGGGGATQQKKTRLRLTFRHDEIQGDGLLQLGQLAQKAAHTSLQAVDISELGKVSTLSFFDYEEALKSFMEASIPPCGMGTSTSTIETLALPKLSSTLSRCLADCLSRAAASCSLLHLTSPGIVWSPTLDAALCANASLVHLQHTATVSMFRDANTKARIQHYLVRNQQVPHLLLCYGYCSGTISSSDTIITETTTANDRAFFPRVLAAARSAHVTGVVQALLELGDDLVNHDHHQEY